MPETRTVALTIPGLLEFRDMAMRVVMESCRLVGRVSDQAKNKSQGNGERHDLPDRYNFSDELTLAFSSAFSEIFNNIVLHAYGGTGAGSIHCELIIAPDHLAVVLTDSGASFDIDTVPALDDPLPMSGMGIHIARTMLDELHYEPGPPNRWRLVKYIQTPSERASSPTLPVE